MTLPPCFYGIVRHLQTRLALLWPSSHIGMYELASASSCVTATVGWAGTALHTLFIYSTWQSCEDGHFADSIPEALRS